MKKLIIIFIFFFNFFFTKIENKNYFLNKKNLTNIAIISLIIYLSYNFFKDEKEKAQKNNNNKSNELQSSENNLQNNFINPEINIDSKYSLNKQIKKSTQSNLQSINYEQIEKDRELVNKENINNLIDQKSFNSIFIKNINQENFNIRYYVVALIDIDSENFNKVKNNANALIDFLNSEKCNLEKTKKEQIKGYLKILIPDLDLNFRLNLNSKAKL